MTLNAKTGEVVTMIGGYDFYSASKFNNATQAYRQTGSCFKPFIYTAAVEWGMTPDTTVSGAPISIGNWQPHNYDGSLGQWRLADEDGAGEVDECSGGPPAANRRHSNRRADGQAFWHQSADGALSAVGARRDRSASGSDGFRLLGISQQRHSRRAAPDSPRVGSRWRGARRVGEDDLQSCE